MTNPDMVCSRAAVILLMLAAGACGPDRGSETAADATSQTPADSVPDRSSGMPVDSLPQSPADSPRVPAPQPPVSANEQPGRDSLGQAGWTVRETRRAAGEGWIATLIDVRTARRVGYDRIVLDFGDTPLPGYRIAYIERPVRQCGSGDVVPFAGDAWLSITVEPANAHTEAGQPTILLRERKLDLGTLLELKLICDFEAMVEWVAAASSPQPYRVFTLTSPARLVIDVRHPSERRLP